METATTIEATEAKTATTVDASDLSRILGNAVLFTSNDRTRPVLCNVRVDVSADAVKVEATDSYALYTDEAAVVGGTAATFLLDRDDAAQVVKLAKGQKGGTVDLFTVGNVTTFTGRGWSVESTDHQGVDSWPRTATLWPADFPSNVGDGVGITLKQMARLGKLTLPDGGTAKTTSPLRFRFVDHLKPMIAESGTLRALIMPCKMP